MPNELNQAEQEILLKLAREALEHSTHSKPLPQLKLNALPPSLRVDGASFVTLTKSGRLRGCIGTLQAYQPLAIDVQEHAVAAALQDSRFPNVQPAELGQINIEVSILSPRSPLQYEGPQDLVNQLRPNIDGVVLQDGLRKATFLPQVWVQIPDPESFLSHLCAKMGRPANLWRERPLQVYTYQVQEFHE